MGRSECHQIMQLHHSPTSDTRGMVSGSTSKHRGPELKSDTGLWLRLLLYTKEPVIVCSYFTQD